MAVIERLKKMFGKRKALEKAREKFYTAIEKVNRREYSDNAPMPGTTGELVGSSQKGRGDKNEIQ